MDIRQLKYFITIAEEGNITKAAERLFMAQPPLSRQLMLMEKELGVTLFNRTNKKNMFLTPQGKVLLKSAKKILLHMDEAITEVQECGKHMTTKLSVGTTIYCSEIMLSAMKTFCEKYPFIVPEVHEGNIFYLINLLKNHTIDVVVTAHPYNTEGYNTKILQPDPCVFVASQEFEWDKDCISLEEISQIPLLLLNAPDANSLYNRILTEFEKRKLQLNISCVSHDPSLLLKMVLNGFGATILPQSLFTPMLSGFISTIPIQNDPWKATPYLIWHSEGYISSTVKKFIREFES